MRFGAGSSPLSGVRDGRGDASGYLDHPLIFNAPPPVKFALTTALLLLFFCSRAPAQTAPPYTPFLPGQQYLFANAPGHPLAESPLLGLKLAVDSLAADGAYALYPSVEHRTPEGADFGQDFTVPSFAGYRLRQTDRSVVFYFGATDSLLLRFAAPVGSR